MRLVTIAYQGKTYVGVKTANGICLTDYSDMQDLIADSGRGLAKARTAASSEAFIKDYKLLAPITNPSKLLCSGVNYRAHSAENSRSKLPQEPSVFAKLPSSIIGPEETIIIPTEDCEVDYEVELAFIIGTTAKNVVKEAALDYVFGYTVINDVSERSRQFRLQHETIGKGFDTFCPMGPEIVLKDEIPDPSLLHVRSFVNGQLRQDSPTSALIFDIPALIAYLTKFITLNPGDIISTGTPSGIGLFMEPPQYLKQGDTVVVEVDKIGRLSNPVAAGWR